MGAVSKKTMERKQVAKTKSKEKTTKLVVIRGGKQVNTKPPKGAVSRRGRPPNPNRVKPYSTILRLTPSLAKRLKKASDKSGVSLNSLLVNMVTVWLDSEG